MGWTLVCCLGFRLREDWEDFRRRVVDVSALELWFAFCFLRALMCMVFIAARRKPQSDIHDPRRATYVAI
jgi:hypothetical protein